MLKNELQQEAAIPEAPSLPYYTSDKHVITTQFHAYTAPPPGHRPTPQAQSILRPSLGPGPLSPEMQLVEPGETERAENKRSAYR